MFDRRHRKLNVSLKNEGFFKLGAVALLGSVALGMGPSAVNAQKRTAQTNNERNATLAYHMKRGDNLYLIAQRHMTNMSSVQVVQKLNNISNPRAIPIGTIVRIPYRLLKYKQETVKIVAWRGAVAVGNNNNPNVGMVLAEGTKIATGQGGFVTLQLANGSRVSIPSQSSVRIAKMREYQINGALDYELTVDKGRINTKAAPLKNPDSRYRIRTPIAVSAVRGTEFRVKLPDENTGSSTEVIEGLVNVFSPASGNDADVPKGVGFSVTPNGHTSMEQLLAAPELVSPGKVQKEELLNFSAVPVAGAVKYTATLATDASMVDEFQEVESETPTFTFQPIPNGKYFIQVSAHSKNGFEGMPANYGFSRRLLTLSGSAEAGDDGSVLFKWNSNGSGKFFHRFQLFRDAVTSTALVDETGLVESHIRLDTLPPGTWYWRVGTSMYDDGTVTETWTTPEKLIIAAEE